MHATLSACLQVKEMADIYSLGLVFTAVYNQRHAFGNLESHASAHERSLAHEHAFCMGMPRCIGVCIGTCICMYTDMCNREPTESATRRIDRMRAAKRECETFVDSAGCESAEPWFKELVGTCVNTCERGIRVDLRTNMCANMYVGVCADMCTGVCADV